VSYGRTDNHTKYKNGGISVAFTGHEELTPRATAGKTECQTGKGHTCKVPDMHRMGNGLLRKPGMKLTDNEVGNERSHNKGDKPAQKMCLAKEDKITYGAHGTETASLCKEPYGKADDQ
jgi:hypothetical protein